MRRRQRKPTARQRSLVPLCEQKRRAEEHAFLVLSVVKQSCNQAHLHSQAQKRARLTTTEAARPSIRSQVSPGLSLQVSPQVYLSLAITCLQFSLQVFLYKSLHRSFCLSPSLVPVCSPQVVLSKSLQVPASTSLQFSLQCSPGLSSSLSKYTTKSVYVRLCS